LLLFQFAAAAGNNQQKEVVEIGENPNKLNRRKEKDTCAWIAW
jgi:hypothetical protein